MPRAKPKATVKKKFPPPPSSISKSKNIEEDREARNKRIEVAVGDGRLKEVVEDGRLTNAILGGSLDEFLSDIQDAINERNQYRQAAILDLVKEVFGDNFTVKQIEGPPVPEQADEEVATLAPAHPLKYHDEQISLSDHLSDGDPLAASEREANMGIESRGARFDIPPGGSGGN